MCIRDRVMTDTVMAAFPYTYLERVRRIATACGGTILDEEFAADVTATARFRVEDTPAFQAQMVELTSGTVHAEVIQTEELLMPWQELK
jgi:putative IMPACT (imprinted ancient) family translation regulator